MRKNMISCENYVQFIYSWFTKIQFLSLRNSSIRFLSFFFYLHCVGVIDCWNGPYDNSIVHLSVCRDTAWLVSHLKPFEVPLVNSRKVDLRLNSSKIRKLQILKKLFHHVLKHFNLTQKTAQHFLKNYSKKFNFVGKFTFFGFLRN